MTDTPTPPTSPTSGNDTPSLSARDSLIAAARDGQQAAQRIADALGRAAQAATREDMIEAGKEVAEALVQSQRLVRLLSDASVRAAALAAGDGIKRLVGEGIDAMFRGKR